MSDNSYWGNSYMTSGSCYSAYRVDNEIRETQTFYEVKSNWVCHYCGSTIRGDETKCSQCGGEKRAQVVSYQSSRTNITYEQDESTKELFNFVPDNAIKDQGWFDKMVGRLFGRDR